jgi:hypothetical protein
VFDLVVALPWTWFITVLAGWLASRRFTFQSKKTNTKELRA